MNCQISPVINIQTAIAMTINSVFGLQIQAEQVPLEIAYPKYNAHYTSTIALALAHRLQLAILEIADAIAKSCSQNPEITAQWQIQVIGKGWLNICLSDVYISGCLRNLLRSQIGGIEYRNGMWQRCDISQSAITQTLDLMVQYAYARCCALMRLAVRENLWLKDESFPNILSYSEISEINLLLQNFAIANYIATDLENKSLSRFKERSKLWRLLAKTFLDFYDRCQIFGVSHEVAMKRLFLIRVTQKLLLASTLQEFQLLEYL
ncbi:DALR anticodon-binding domain-containing protein [Pseudanabaena mucicola]|uniref:DALR anticodon binding domain-containing protein n=1 Tax=Pseudanabaena mucicola FACHB-723 TaxID=2692860 RepID=A0ABR7ZVS7_9CYAN|nr:DALR anticodon-binding domain-containing protein [Pseudanabaena mucicola]MBD2187351.1 hypothetical protein [Pseudanabaena mucicola FACHB-723]